MFNNIAHFNLFKFSWFKQFINILRFMASTSKAFYFCFLLLPNLWKIARQFKILTVLYFYRFIIIFSLTLQQVLLAIELNKVTNFSIPFAFENIYNKIRYDERTLAIDYLHLLLAYDIFLKEILQIERIPYYILKVFEGNLKNVCQKAIKTNSSSFLNKRY